MAVIEASGGQARGSVSVAVQQPIRSLIPARIDRLRWSPFRRPSRDHSPRSPKKHPASDRVLTKRQAVPEREMEWLAFALSPARCAGFATCLIHMEERTEDVYLQQVRFGQRSLFHCSSRSHRQTRILHAFTNCTHEGPEAVMLATGAPSSSTPSSTGNTTTSSFS